MSPHRIVTENQLTITVAVVDIKPLSPLLVRSILLPMGNIPEQVDMHHPFPHIFHLSNAPVLKPTAETLWQTPMIDNHSTMVIN